MNDFTKEELEDTLYALEQWVHPLFDIEKYVKLRNKIRSRIDRYCDHIWMSNPSQNDCLLYCMKCRIYKISNSQKDIFK